MAIGASEPVWLFHLYAAVFGAEFVDALDAEGKRPDAEELPSVVPPASSVPPATEMAVSNT